MAPVAFFVLAMLTAGMNKIRLSMEARGKDASRIGSGGCVDMDCNNCAERGTCTHKFIDTDAVPGESLEEGALRREQENASDKDDKEETVNEETGKEDE
jgi:electron transport complex protein RnfE